MVQQMISSVYEKDYIDLQLRVWMIIAATMNALNNHLIDFGFDCFREECVDLACYEIPLYLYVCIALEPLEYNWNGRMATVMFHIQDR